MCLDTDEFGDDVGVGIAKHQIGDALSPLRLAPGERALNRSDKGPVKPVWDLADSGWQADQTMSEAMRTPLMRLCGRYLVDEKGTNGRTLDPVAHFHLSNGASMEELHWKADRSVKGHAQSAGMMMNYLYDLGRIDDIHEAYTSTGEIAVSSSLKNLLKG